jgi:hypothetical protein
LTIFHNVTLSVGSLLSDNGEKYLFNDDSLTCAVTAGLNFAELFPAQLSSNITYPWGAPFYDFTLGQPQYARSGSSQVRVMVPFSFENHASFNSTGTIRLRLYDNGDSLLGESQLAFNVPQYAFYAGSFEFSVPSNLLSQSGQQSGHFEGCFSTSLFEYGPVVIPYD